MTAISPELALVDPELRRLASAALPDPADCLAPRQAIEVHFAAYAAAMPVRVRGGTGHRSRRMLRRGFVVGAWIVLAGIVSAPLLAFLPPARAPSIAGAPAARLPTPRTASKAGVSGSTIYWSAIPGAKFYDLVLTSGAQRVDLWQAKPWARVTSTARPEAAMAPRVTYRWHVYPAFTTATGTFRYGSLIASGSITVRQGTLRPSSPAP